MAKVNSAPIVVGVDGSEPSLRAVRTSAQEAVRRGRPLRVVHAFTWPLLRVPLGPVPGVAPESGLRHQADQVAAEAANEAKRAAPNVTVNSEVVEGSAAAVLLREAQDAAMIVIGDRGLGGFGGLLLGSVAVQVAGHASCPVLVVRGEVRESGPVVVGVDGSPLSDLAVGFAIEEAALRGTELVAVHAWRYPVSTGPGDMLPLVYDIDALRDEEERLLAQAIAGWQSRHPHVPIIHRLVEGRPAQSLIAESATAQLVVVGARGRGGFAGLILGSVSQSVLHHSQCPLTIVHQGQPKD